MRTILLITGVLVAVIAAAPAHAQHAAEIFEGRCARCHGKTGKSDTPDARALKVQPLVDNPRRATMSAAEIAATVRSNPKHQGVVKLDDAELQKAAAFVRQLARTR
jgi:mono/diheme cytochrome c family protein